MSVSPIEAGAGLLLLFFLPGLALTLAVFPEWRLRGAEGPERLAMTTALSVTMSVALTVVVGFGLLALPGGFSAAWSDPLLEEVLAVVTIAGAVLAWRRGRFAREPPRPSPAPEAPDEDGAWPAVRALEGLAREERRVRHALRIGPETAETARLRQRLAELEEERRRITDARRADLAE